VSAERRRLPGLGSPSRIGSRWPPSSPPYVGLRRCVVLSVSFEADPEGRAPATSRFVRICSMTTSGPAPRDRVVQAGSRIPPAGRFRHLVQIVTLPRPVWRSLQVAGTTRFQPTAGPSHMGAGGNDPRPLKGQPRGGARSAHLATLPGPWLGSGYLVVPARVLPSTPPSRGWKEVPRPTSERSASHGCAGS
jgi:hypothetical protein